MLVFDFSQNLYTTHTVEGERLFCAFQSINRDFWVKQWHEIGDDRNRAQEATCLIPFNDRFQRYEASLDRSFDRTLSQLERLQRVRSGQPVLPAIKVDVSH